MKSETPPLPLRWANNDRPALGWRIHQTPEIDLSMRRLLAPSLVLCLIGCGQHPQEVEATRDRGMQGTLQSEIQKRFKPEAELQFRNDTITRDGDTVNAIRTACGEVRLRLPDEEPTPWLRYFGTYQIVAEGNHRTVTGVEDFDDDFEWKFQEACG